MRTCHLYPDSTLIWSMLDNGAILVRTGGVSLFGEVHHVGRLVLSI